jgi:lipoyl-dependent peroxiredoxin
MALAKLLSQAHHRPGRIETTARVHMNQQSGEPVISLMELDTQAEMSAIDEQEVQRHAEAAKVGCPVSKLFAGADIRLRPMLVTR